MKYDPNQPRLGDEDGYSAVWPGDVCSGSRTTEFGTYWTAARSETVRCDRCGRLVTLRRDGRLPVHRV